MQIALSELCTRPPCDKQYLANAERVFSPSRKRRKAAFDGRVDILVSLGASPLGGVGGKHKEGKDELSMDGLLV